MNIISSNAIQNSVSRKILIPQATPRTLYRT